MTIKEQMNGIVEKTNELREMVLPECAKCGGLGEIPDCCPCGDEKGIPCPECAGTGRADNEGCDHFYEDVDR